MTLVVQAVIAVATAGVFAWAVVYEGSVEIGLGLAVLGFVIGALAWAAT